MLDFQKTFLSTITFLIIYFIRTGLIKEKCKLKHVLIIVLLSLFVKPVLDYKTGLLLQKLALLGLRIHLS